MPEQRSIQQLRAEIARERLALNESLGGLREEAAWGGQQLALVAGIVVALVVVGKLVGLLRRR